jgi:hypothetical protein
MITGRNTGRVGTIVHLERHRVRTPMDIAQEFPSTFPSGRDNDDGDGWRVDGEEEESEKQHESHRARSPTTGRVGTIVHLERHRVCTPMDIAQEFPSTFPSGRDNDDGDGWRVDGEEEESEKQHEPHRGRSPTTKKVKKVKKTNMHLIARDHFPASSRAAATGGEWRREGKKRMGVLAMEQKRSSGPRPL